MFLNTDRKVTIGSSLILFWITLTMFTDQSTINPAYFNWFLASKLLLLVGAISLTAMAVRGNFFGLNPNKSFLVLAAGYCCLGEVFCPGYHLAFIQIVVVSLLIYETNKSFVFKYLLAFPITYLLIYSLFNFNNVGVTGYESYSFDIQVSVISVTALTLGLYFYVLKFKQEKEYFSKKYEFLGKNMSSKIHELKAELLAPTFSLDQIINYSDRYSPEEQKEMLSEVKTQLFNLKESLKKANEFSKMDTETVSVKELVDRYTTHFRLTNVKFSGKQNVTGNKEKIDVVIKNLFKNAVENSDRNVPIAVEVSDQEIVFKDNGGGYPRELLSKLNEGIPVVSEKKDGNGVGLSSIHNLVQQMNGSIKFYNKDAWACVKIII